MENNRNYEEFDDLFSQDKENDFFMPAKEQIWNKIQEAQLSPKKKIIMPFVLAKYAAVLAMGLGIGYLFFHEKEVIIIPQEVPIVIAPPVQNLPVDEIPKVVPESVNHQQLQKKTPQTFVAKNNPSKPSNVIHPQDATVEIVQPTALKTIIENNTNLPQYASAQNTTETKVITLADVLPQPKTQRSSKIEKRIAKSLQTENEQYANSVNIKALIKSF